MTDFQKPEQSGQAAALPKTYAQHPLSAAFPAMTPEEFQELKDSIENIGVQNPITLLDGMVIDGWHRYSACLELVMECPVVELAPDTDPRDFVVAQNQARRHITKGQLIAAASKVYQWRPNGGNQSALSAECISSKQMAEKLNVGVRSVEQFRVVERQAAPAVVDAVNRGELGLPKAVAIAKLPPDQQAQAISKPLPRPVVVVPPPPSSAPHDPWDDLPPGDSTTPEGMNPDDYGPSEEELAAAEAADRAERELVQKMLEADDKQAMLFEEVKQLKAEVDLLRRRRDEYMNQAAAAQKAAKKFEAQNRRLLKELDALKKGSAA
jgi:hypothetical protein